MAGAFGLFIIGYQWGNQHRFGQPPAIEGVLLAPAMDLPAFTLADQRGRPLDREDLRGRWTLIAFGDLTQARGQLGIQRLLEVFNRLAGVPELRDRLQLVFAASRQPADLAQDFGRLSPALRLVADEAGDLGKLTSLLGEPPQPDPGQAPTLYLIGPQARLLAFFPSNQPAQRVADDLTLLAHWPLEALEKPLMINTAPSWSDRLFVGIQQLLPQHALSAAMYRLARLEWPPLSAPLIRSFAQHFEVDMSEALEPDLAAYPSFNAFFTRALRPGVRPQPADPTALICPADGALSQHGAIAAGRLFQAKGLDYGLTELVGDPGWAEMFQGGSFATIYLSPRDYHRVHMPAAGRLREMIHVPGHLFSVNRATASLVPGLFARNERVVCLFEGEAGPFALILVGAIFVGGMETVWAGEVTPARGQPPRRYYDEGEAIHLARGAEMGRFNLGSTVILLFPPGAVTWTGGLAPGLSLRMGQDLGQLRMAANR